MRNLLPLIWLTLLSLSNVSGAALQADVEETVVSKGVVDSAGVRTHLVTSLYQPGRTTLRVLLPSRLIEDRLYRVVYVLPVEPNDERKYGDGLLEVQRLDLANKFDAIFVAPSFSQMPWYADHPRDKTVRQESYLLKVVVPWIEAHYPARAQASGRLLLGFSKSGWGALSLLLRHPDLFGRAAAWDAPLMLGKPGKYGSAEIFGTQENFDAYSISKLLERDAALLQAGKRLGLFGYGNFREDHLAASALMRRLKIDFVSKDGPERKHEWTSGWVPEAVDFLLGGEAGPASRP